MDRGKYCGLGFGADTKKLIGRKEQQIGSGKKDSCI